MEFFPSVTLDYNEFVDVRLSQLILIGVLIEEWGEGSDRLNIFCTTSNKLSWHHKLSLIIHRLLKYLEKFIH